MFLYFFTRRRPHRLSAVLLICTFSTVVSAQQPPACVLFAGSVNVEKVIHSCTQVIDQGRAANLEGAYVARGFNYLLKGDRERARADYNKAILINPNYVDAYGYRAGLNSGEKRYTEALSDYNRVIALNPKGRGPYKRRAGVYYQLNQLDRAVTDLDQAVRIIEIRATSNRSAPSIGSTRCQEIALTITRRGRGSDLHWSGSPRRWRMPTQRPE